MEKLCLISLINMGFYIVLESLKRVNPKQKHYIATLYSSNAVPSNDPKTRHQFNHNDYDNGHYGGISKDLFPCISSLPYFFHCKHDVFDPSISCFRRSND
jgi:hypothetical protein